MPTEGNSDDGNGNGNDDGGGGNDVAGVAGTPVGDDKNTTTTSNTRHHQTAKGNKSPVKSKAMRAVASFGQYEIKKVHVPPLASRGATSGTTTTSGTTSTVPVSGLATMFLSNNNTFISPASSLAGPFDRPYPTGKTKLTIYLPDCTSMVVIANIHSSFDELIRKVLYDHKQLGLKPPLYYHAPEFYELRMHDMDGEPDLDLPALDRKKTMKDMMFDTEYCLTEIDEDAQPPSLIESFDKDNKLLGRAASSSSTVVLHFPQGDQIHLAFDELTTLRDLLPVIAKQKKLRLYTDEFVFYIYSPEEQARLKLMSPIVDPSAPIASLGTREFQLQKRLYADSYLQKRVVKHPASHHRHTPRMQDGQISSVLPMASVYQEWNVVKKNVFGRKQDRILGIDGSGVYNLRVGGAQDSGAMHSRQISSIRNIEPVEYDRKGFKITWEEDNREVVEIEYLCQSEKECSEIVNKLSFLISALKR